jgi:SAM-dependent methyltransferase
VQSSVYEAPHVLDERFDVVYASRGALGWLPSIERWAQVVDHFLAPGGFVYVHEGHPVLWSIDDEQQASNPIRLAHDYWEGDVITSPVQGSYADPSASVRATREHGWNHGLGEILTALAQRGLRLEFLHEHRFLSWPAAFLVADPEGNYRWPEGQRGSLPLMYSLKARKPS